MANLFAGILAMYGFFATSAIAMRRRGIFILLLLCGLFGRAQDCPDLVSPSNNQTGVPVTTSISWTETTGVNGYIISLGTTPGGVDLVNQQAVGLETTFTPPLGLPELTDIYVTITLFFINQQPIVCPSQKFTTEDVTSVPECTMLESPIDGEQGVGTGTFLRWFYAARATGYRLNVSTTPDGGEIINNLDVGNELFYDPPGDLPVDSDIYVRITPYNENGGAAGCSEEQFRTGGGGDPPGCTNLINPADGAVNVGLSPIITWEPVPEALGYIVFIGGAPTNNDILDGVVFTSTSISVINFEPNRTYFVRIIPFNDAGEAQGCVQESFSTILGCGPFFDPDTGELITLAPKINFPSQVGLCMEALPFTVQTTDQADGFRWFRILEGGDEVLVGEGASVSLELPGEYRYEAYNVLTQNGFDIECSTTSNFVATLSSSPEIVGLERFPLEDSFDVEVLIRGTGDYELALNNPEGPYTAQTRFTNLPPGDYTVHVRDRKGCGDAEQSFKLAFPPPGFPPYFSPNGDGIQDFWQYRPPNTDPLELKLIEVYDRYGKILETFLPAGQGWNGTYRGTPLPAGGYWYRAVDIRGVEYKGHFSLIR